MKRKTIFFLHAVNISANPQQVLSVARAWYNQKYRVVMFTPWEKLDAVHEQFDIFRIPALTKGHLRTFTFGIGLFFILPILAFWYKPVMIYSRQVYPEAFAIALIKLFIKTKYVLNINGWRSAEKMDTGDYHILNGVSRLCYRFSYILSDKITTVTPEISNAIVIEYSYDSKKIMMIGNGVNLSLFNPVDREVSCKALSLDINFHYALFCGSFKKWHGLDFGIEMFQQLLTIRNDIRLIVIGSSLTDKDNSVMTKAETMANSLKNEGKIIFTGFMDPTRIPLWYGCATLMLTFHPQMPMLNYGLAPLKIPEYMASERAILSTDVGGLGNFLKRWDCGLSSPPGDKSAYIDNVLKLLDNPKKRQCLAENGRKAAVSYFDWNVIANNILSFAEIE